MIVYNYSNITGELISQGEAKPNPMELGKYLIPANATDKYPPKISKNEVCIFNRNSGTWDIKPDFRGTTLWDTSSKEKVEIKEIGVTPGENCTELEPTENSVWKGGKWKIDTELWLTNSVRPKRDKLLNDCLWMVDRHIQQRDLIKNEIIIESSISEQQFKELLIYIQELRDLPGKISIDSPIFPIKPTFMTN